MKLVFLITELDYSGGPKMMAWVANQFANKQHEVTFIAVYSDKVGQPLEQNVEFIFLGMKKNTNRFIRNTVEMLMIEKAINKEINRINPDIVVGFLYSVDYFYTLFNSNKRRKIVLSQRLDPYAESGISSIIKKKIIEKADGIVFQSYGAKDYYDDVIRKKSCVIPNPVTQKTLVFQKLVKSFEERENIIVLPARLDILQKRQDVMLDAFEIVVKNHPEMKLVFLGNGPDKERINEIIHKKQLVGKAYIHPAVKTAEEFVKNCKIACITSDFEGLPNSLIEALALGINVVATDCSPGAARMLIEDGNNGFLVSRGDYRKIAEGINKYLQNPDYANRISKEAKKIADIYSEKTISHKWIEYIDGIYKQ